MSAAPDPVDLERIYPKSMDKENEHDRASIDIHEERYRFAAQHLHGHTIVDLACGCGFGTALMADANPKKQFIGIDIDEEAIAYARQHYAGDNREFVCANAMTVQLRHVDTIVSLETIEHLEDAGQFIARLPALLSPSGRVIASVPITPTRDGNPHHLHDFTRRSFYRLFTEQGFKAGEFLRQRQAWVYQQAFAKNEDKHSRSYGVGNNIMAYYRQHPWALVTRALALLRHGPCNLYLTTLFDRALEPSDAS